MISTTNEIKRCIFRKSFFGIVKDVLIIIALLLTNFAHGGVYSRGRHLPVRLVHHSFSDGGSFLNLRSFNEEDSERWKVGTYLPNQDGLGLFSYRPNLSWIFLIKLDGVILLLFRKYVGSSSAMSLLRCSSALDRAVNIKTGTVLPHSL